MGVILQIDILRYKYLSEPLIIDLLNRLNKKQVNMDV